MDRAYRRLAMTPASTTELRRQSTEAAAEATR